MTSRERVLKSFHHETPDRVSLDYSAVPEMDQLLIGTFGLPDREALLRRLHVDFRHLDKWGTMVPRYRGPETRRFTDGTYEDTWGCRLKNVEYRPGCFYEEWVGFPLAEARTVRDVEKHAWPDPDWYDFCPVAVFCQENDAYFLAGGWGATLDSVGFFRGREQAMLDTYDHPKIVEAIVEKLFEFKYEYNARLLAAAGGRLDMLFISEDMGGQDALIVSRDMLKRYVFPRFRAFSDLARKHNALTMLHSDGAIRDIIPDLIDLGIDVIDPVQANCPGMDAAGLKRDFGDRLSFHGVMDSQKLLPYGSPEEVRSEARRLVETMGADGGLALGVNNNMQIDVPIENVLALYDGIGTE
ncbi:MAG: uroporphyrinogen decarboxylase family protein [Candidatus Latescibacterota bacterium]